MNPEDDVFGYKWELVASNNENGEKISIPCSPNSIGSIINQIVKEDAEGVWEAPDWVRPELEKILVNQVISIDLVSQITKIEKTKLERFLNDRSYELKSTSATILILMELTKNLSLEA